MKNDQSTREQTEKVDGFKTMILIYAGLTLVQLVLIQLCGDSFASFLASGPMYAPMI